MRTLEMIARDIIQLEETFSGCDWCCGGGDEQMAKLEKELGSLTSFSTLPQALIKELDRRKMPSNVIEWIPLVVAGEWDLDLEDAKRLSQTLEGTSVEYWYGLQRLGQLKRG